MITKVSILSLNDKKEIQDIGVEAKNIINTDDLETTVAPKNHTSTSGATYGAASSNVFGHIKLGEGLEINNVDGSTQVKTGDNGFALTSTLKNQYSPKYHANQNGQVIGTGDETNYGHVQLQCPMIVPEFGYPVIPTASGIAADFQSTQDCIDELDSRFKTLSSSFFPIGSRYEAEPSIDPNNFLKGTWEIKTKKLKELQVIDDSTYITRYSTLSSVGNIRLTQTSNLLSVTLENVQLSSTGSDNVRPLANINFDKLGIQVTSDPTPYCSYTVGSSDGGNAICMLSFVTKNGTIDGQGSYKIGDINMDDSILKNASGHIAASKGIYATFNMPITQKNIIQEKADSLIWERVE